MCPETSRGTEKARGLTETPGGLGPLSLLSAYIIPPHTWPVINSLKRNVPSLSSCKTHGSAWSWTLRSLCR